jgi:hypothetical protein
MRKRNGTHRRACPRATSLVAAVLVTAVTLPGALAAAECTEDFDCPARSRFTLALNGGYMYSSSFMLYGEYSVQGPVYQLESTVTWPLKTPGRRVGIRLAAHLCAPLGRVFQDAHGDESGSLTLSYLVGGTAGAVFELGNFFVGPGISLHYDYNDVETDEYDVTTVKGKGVIPLFGVSMGYRWFLSSHVALQLSAEWYTVVVINRAQASAGLLVAF